MLKTRHSIVGPGGGKFKRQGIAVAAVIIVAAIVAAYFLTQPSVTGIASTKTVSLRANQTSYFSVLGSIVVVRLQSSSAGAATFYASQTPVLFGSISLFSLTPGASANVSSSGSGTADMNVRLVSGSATGATVSITPLPASLDVRPSSSVSVLSPLAFGASGGTAVGSSGNLGSVGSGAPGATTASTTVATTTTVAQSASATQQ